MSTSLIFLLVGAALLVGGTVSFRENSAVTIRALSAGALAAGSLMFLIGLVNALSGTM